MAEEMSDFAAAYHIGGKVIEAADRVLAFQKAVPRAEARWKFQMEGTWFEITVVVSTAPKNG